MLKPPGVKLFTSSTHLSLLITSWYLTLQHFHYSDLFQKHPIPQRWSTFQSSLQHPSRWLPPYQLQKWIAIVCSYPLIHTQYSMVLTHLLRANIAKYTVGDVNDAAMERENFPLLDSMRSERLPISNQLRDESKTGNNYHGGSHYYCRSIQDSTTRWTIHWKPEASRYYDGGIQLSSTKWALWERAQAPSQLARGVQASPTGWELQGRRYAQRGFYPQPIEQHLHKVPRSSV